MVLAGHLDTVLWCASDTSMCQVGRPTEIRHRISCHLQTTHGEIVRERASWSNLTLRHTRRTVHVCSSVLKQAVKVKTCGLVAEVILDVDDDIIAFCHCDCRNRPLAIDSNDRSIVNTVWIGIYPANVEVVRDRDGVSDTGQEEGSHKAEAQHRHDEVRSNQVRKSTCYVDIVYVAG